MADDGKESSFINAAKNEYVLLLYRAVTAGCCLFMTWWIMDLKNATQEMRKDFNISLIMNEARIAKLEGKVDVIDVAVRMQSRSIESNQTTLQSLWNRMYELNRSPIQSK